MNGFRHRLALAIANSEKYKDDVWSLARDAKLGKKTVYNMLHDDRLDTSNTGPGIFGLSRVAYLLGTSLDDLAGMKRGDRSVDMHSQRVLEHLLLSVAKNEGRTISSDGLLRTYRRSGGQIEAFNDLLDRCDQYEIPKPDDTHPKVIAVGKYSLSAITMGSNSRELLETSLRDMSDQELLRRTMHDYREASSRGTLVTLEERDIRMPSKPIKVKMDYIRTLLRVEDPNGKATLLLLALLAN